MGRNLTGTHRYVISTSDGDPVATVHALGRHMVEVDTPSSGTQTCALKKRRGFPHIKSTHCSEFTDVATGASVLRVTGTHFNYEARTIVHMSGERLFRFPVQGTRTSNGLLTAIDDAGNAVFRVRLVPKKGRGLAPVGRQVVVAPGQTINTELIWVIYLSLPLIIRFFTRGGGG